MNKKIIDRIKILAWVDKRIGKIAIHLLYISIAI